VVLIAISSGINCNEQWCNEHGWLLCLILIEKFGKLTQVDVALVTDG
jgi:hypothetical protein